MSRISHGYHDAPARFIPDRFRARCDTDGVVGFCRVVLLAIAAPAVGSACSTGGQLGAAPDGGDGGGWTLPDARVTTTPGPTCSMATNPNPAHDRPAGLFVRRRRAGVLHGRGRRTGATFPRGRLGRTDCPSTFAESITAVAMAPDGTGTFSWAAGGDPFQYRRHGRERERRAPVAGGRLVGHDRRRRRRNRLVAGASPPYPVLALDESGAAQVAWSRIDQWVDGWPSSIWSSQVGTDGVVTQRNIDQPGGTWSSTPTVIARGSGDAVAVWRREDDSRSEVLLARRVGTAWTTPKVLESFDKSAGQGVSDRPAGRRSNRRRWCSSTCAG